MVGLFHMGEDCSGGSGPIYDVTSLTWEDCWCSGLLF